MNGRVTLKTVKNKTRIIPFNDMERDFLIRKLRFSDSTITQLIFSRIQFSSTTLSPLLDAIKDNQSLENLEFHQCTFANQLNAVTALINEFNANGKQAKIIAWNTNLSVTNKFLLHPGMTDVIAKPDCAPHNQRPLNKR